MVNKPNLKPYFLEAHRLAKQFGLEDIKIKWVRRELNKEADKLSKIALKQVQGEREHINS